MPTAFSPNRDGINDDFRAPTTASWQLAELEIFDRWGNFLFRSQEVDGWNGMSSSGQECPPSVYVYRAVLLREEPFDRREIFGDVTLMK